MPIHDWTRVDAGLFHDFHQRWSIALSNALNSGVLPPAYFALVEQSLRGPIPDVLTLELSGEGDGGEVGGLAVSTSPPQTRVVQRTEAGLYTWRANRIAVRHRHGEVVAVIEIVSPGNKASQAAFKAFVEKSADLVEQGIHLLIIDLFPPGKRDPEGIHRAIWGELSEEGDFTLPADKPLTLAAYSAGAAKTAYVEPIAVGDILPDMPVFLAPDHYVNAPLESSYQAAWETFPGVLKRLLTD